MEMNGFGCIQQEWVHGKAGDFRGVQWLVHIPNAEAWLIRGWKLDLVPQLRPNSAK